MSQWLRRRVGALFLIATAWLSGCERARHEQHQPQPAGKTRMPNFAACGASFCDARTSYCEIYLSDVPELPTDHFCRPLPNACKPVNGVAKQCDCFPASTPCLSFCGPLPTGGIDAFHLTCQGKKPPYGAATKSD